MPKALPHLSTDAALEAGRGRPRPPHESPIAKHIEVCATCEEKVNRWSGLAAVAARLRAADPSDEVVGRARALACESRQVRPVIPLSAALRYHSARVPPPAGVRGAALLDPVVYHAQEFAVELRVSRTRSRQIVIVVGQITDLERPARRLGGVPVQLQIGHRAIMRAISNAWGEFYFEAAEQAHMWLEVGPAEDRAIRIPLRPKPDAQATGGDA